jgi:hypothetical protein
VPSLPYVSSLLRFSIGALAAAVAIPSLVAADGVLFPNPIHLVRRIEDPLSKSVQTVDEYCSGNRIVTVNGSKVAITDYDRQQVTEIDHKAGTWSVTRFDEIAKARAALAPRAASPQSKVLTAASESAGPAPAPRWKTTSLGTTRGKSTLATETFALDSRASSKSSQHLEIGVDRTVRLSRQAVEVLIGAAYPGTHRSEDDEILAMAAGGPSAVSGDPRLSAQNADPTYALPVEQTTTVESDGSTLTIHNSILRVGNESAPAQLMLIEPGSKRVDSHLVRLARELHDVETLPSRNTQPRHPQH